MTPTTTDPAPARWVRYGPHVTASTTAAVEAGALLELPHRGDGHRTYRVGSVVPPDRSEADGVPAGTRIAYVAAVAARTTAAGRTMMLGTYTDGELVLAAAGVADPRPAWVIVSATRPGRVGDDDPSVHGPHLVGHEGAAATTVSWRLATAAEVDPHHG